MWVELHPSPLSRRPSAHSTTGAGAGACPSFQSAGRIAGFGPGLHGAPENHRLKKCFQKEGECHVFSFFPGGSCWYPPYTWSLFIFFGESLMYITLHLEWNPTLEWWPLRTTRTDNDWPGWSRGRILPETNNGFLPWKSMVRRWIYDVDVDISITVEKYPWNILIAFLGTAVLFRGISLHRGTQARDASASSGSSRAGSRRAGAFRTVGGLFKMQGLLCY